MSDRCNIQVLAEAMYKRECDHYGDNHGAYCISENVKTLQSFEDEIERLENEHVHKNLYIKEIDDERKRLDKQVESLQNKLANRPV